MMDDTRALTILIVDDSATDRAIIRGMLGEYNTLTAVDGRQAMDILDGKPGVDLMILDLNMPVMDGFQVLEAMRGNDRYKDVRTIILTDYEAIDKEIRGLELGAVDFIRKPIHMESLRARIRVHTVLLAIKHALQQQLSEQKTTLELIFGQVPVGIAISYNKDPLLSDDNPHFSVNPAFEQISGRTRAELRDLGWAAITHPDDLEENVRLYNRLKAGNIQNYQMEKRIIRPDGSVVWVRLLVAALEPSERYRFNHIALFEDITEKKLMEKKLIASERSKDTLLSHLPGMAYRCSFDPQWTMQYVSAGCLELTGYPAHSLIGSAEVSFNELITPEYRDRLWVEWERVIKERIPFSYEYEIMTKTGQRKWVLEKGQGVYDEQGTLEALEGIIIDISDRKAMESVLKYNNEHDQWTGLLNRGVLDETMQNDLDRMPFEKRGIIAVNLSPLRALTVSYGFNYTQKIIKRVAASLQALCGEGMTLYYPYDKRFVVHVSNYRDHQELAVFAGKVREMLEKILSSERTGGSVAVMELDGLKDYSVEDIMTNLWTASEIANEQGENDIHLCLYDDQMERGIVRNKMIEQELNRMIAQKSDAGLYLVYQPIFDLRTNRICEFEALARISSPTLSVIPPLDFINIAEKTKQILPIGDMIFRQALRFLKKMEDQGIPGIRVSINVSVIQLNKRDFTGYFLGLINEFGVSPQRVGIEITESVFSKNYKDINEIIARLKSEGIQISIDDFGVGYSSFARESELDVDCLKIDKFFIDKLTQPKSDGDVIEDIISIAHRLSQISVAEGVEYAQQLERLRVYGCDRVQGYFISRPLDEDGAVSLIGQEATQGIELEGRDE